MKEKKIERKNNKLNMTKKNYCSNYLKVEKSEK